MIKLLLLLLLSIALVRKAEAGYYDPCFSNPCVNDGACVGYGYDDTYNCYCEEGWYGTTCADPTYNACASSPCQNLGSCTNGAFDTYSCNCQVGWGGDNCEVSPSNCPGDSDCGTGVCLCAGDSWYFSYFGTCTDGLSCACYPNYNGTHCEVFIPCPEDPVYNPCKNGGTCSVVGDDYSCNCNGTGYDGTNCTHNACDSSPCDNGGTCFPGETATEFSCECPEYYTGEDCQEHNYCASMPCLHGGACSNRATAFHCNCAGTGYVGVTCAIFL